MDTTLFTSLPYYYISIILPHSYIIISYVIVTVLTP